MIFFKKQLFTINIHIKIRQLPLPAIAFVLPIYKYENTKNTMLNLNLQYAAIVNFNCYLNIGLAN